MNSAPRYIWDKPGIVDDLKAILEKGATAGEAAANLRRAWGVYVSRSAVIGKAYRLGLELRSQGSHSPSVKPKARTKPPSRIKPKPIVTVRMPVMTDEPQPIGDVGGGCQWLRGDATKRHFCGHVTWPLSPWCPFHFSRVYQRPPIRRDVRDAA